jgi:hypothetical protein
MLQLCFNFNRIHDSVGKALRTANQRSVIANSHALSYSFHPGLTISLIFLIAYMDLLPNEQNFALDKSRQKFHHSLKEHHKISNIPKFRCEML